MKIIRSPINDLGYGLFGIGLYKKLIQIDNSWNLCELNGKPSPNEYEKSILDQFKIDYITNNQAFNKIAETEKTAEINCSVFHASQLRTFLNEHARNFAFIHFETDRLSVSDMSGLEKVDKIFVCSPWAKQILIKHGFKEDIIQDNIGISFPLLSSDYSKQRILSTDTYKELQILFNKIRIKLPPFVFTNVGKLEVRKGHYSIIKALSLSKLPVTMVTLWSNPFMKDYGYSELHNALIQEDFKLTQSGTFQSQNISIYQNEHDTTVFVLPRLKSYIDVLRTIALSNCYICASSGEGWNMPAVEAMGLGVPIILPKNTAHLAYSSKIKYMLECETALAYDGLWFNGNQGNWYPVKLDSLVETIKTAFKEISSGPINTIDSASIESITDFDKISTENIKKSFV